MTTIEHQILAFICERTDMHGFAPSRGDICRHVGTEAARHIVNSLWDLKLIEAVPFRRPGNKFTFQITDSGRAALKVAA